MKRFSDKETFSNLTRGFFKVAVIFIIAMIIWSVLALLGLDVNLDLLSAKYMAICFTLLLVGIWYLFKYYDRNNP